MRPGRFISLAAQCLRPFLIAEKTFVNAPRAILRFPGFCHHGPVNVSTISHLPFGRIALALAGRAQGCRAVPSQSYRSHPSYFLVTPTLPRCSALKSTPAAPMSAHFAQTTTSDVGGPHFATRFCPLPQMLEHQPPDRIVPHLPALVVRLVNRGESKSFKVIQACSRFRFFLRMPAISFPHRSAWALNV